MKDITFYFDVISPYAYLAFERLPHMLKGLSYSVRHKPVLFAGLLKHYGQLGPAEIAPKRDWTYRQVLWLAHQHGVNLQFPDSHPFNPLALMRLAVACDALAEPNRYVCEAVFRHVWRGGAQADAPERLQALTACLAPMRDPGSAAVKTALREHTEQAIANGVFGVPTFEVDGKLFWGLDALPMLRDYLEGGVWFASASWDAVRAVKPGLTRVR